MSCGHLGYEESVAIANETAHGILGR